jgi:hypothetical protein
MSPRTKTSFWDRESALRPVSRSRAYFRTGRIVLLAEGGTDPEGAP